ncbi:MAG: chromosomal replication initiator protein DnaA, partial [Thermoplasmata archaeon]|nr:chromosomal replication initiator protein DnaA [Thermoplasmata archaeon]
MSEVLSTSVDFLPEGKLIRTIRGGEDTLKKSLIKLKKYEFTGYVKSMVKRAGILSEGYLIIKNGVPVAAIYGKRPGDDFQVMKQGEKALKLAWVDSYDEECQIEVRGRVEVDTFMSAYPESSITVLKSPAQKQQRSKVGLSWGDEAQSKAAKEVSDREMKDLKKELDAWTSQGLVVHTLEDALNTSIEEAKKLFSEFRDNLRKVEFFKEDLEHMDTTGHDTEVKKLEALFKNPMKITAIEAAMEDISDKVELMEEPGAFKLDKAEAPEIRPAGGYGEVIPGEGTEDTEDRCSVCGGDMKGLDECPTCGAVRKDMKSSGMDKLDILLKTRDTGLISAYTFENFVVGEKNRFSQSAALAVAKADSISYNPLLICGGVGLGKTHIINAIGNYVAEHKKDKKILYITTEKFIQKFMDATKSNKMKAFRNKYRKIDLLLLDDIQFIAGQEAVQDELFHTFNALHKDQKQIVMTSDSPLHDIPGIKERLVSRFESGLPTDIQSPDLETRMNILRMKAEAVDFDVGDDVLKIIARSHVSNVRSLEGALNKIIAYCRLMKVAPTTSVAMEVIADESKKAGKPEAKTKPEERDVDIFKDKIESDRLKISHSYLIEEDRPQQCFELFVETLDLGFNG